MNEQPPPTEVTLDYSQFVCSHTDITSVSNAVSSPQVDHYTGLEMEGKGQELILIFPKHSY